jgi:hypothetical protein
LKAKELMVNTTEAESEAKEIANKFETIFSERDVDPRHQKNRYSKRT